LFFSYSFDLALYLATDIHRLVGCWRAAFATYFVKLAPMPDEYGTGKWNYDIFGILSRLLKPEV
jgi:hypothetical protein